MVVSLKETMLSPFTKVKYMEKKSFAFASMDVLLEDRHVESLYQRQVNDFFASIVVYLKDRQSQEQVNGKTLIQLCFRIHRQCLSSPFAKGKWMEKEFIFAFTSMDVSPEHKLNVNLFTKST